jgi:hypothetical protein
MMDSVIPTTFVCSRGRVGGKRLLEVSPDRGGRCMIFSARKEDFYERSR